MPGNAALHTVSTHALLACVYSDDTSSFFCVVRILLPQLDVVNLSIGKLHRSGGSVFFAGAIESAHETTSARDHVRLVVETTDARLGPLYTGASATS